MTDFWKTQNLETVCIGTLRRTKPSEDYPYANASDAAERFFHAAAHIPGEGILGLQFFAEKDSILSGLVFSDASVTAEDLAWIFAPYAAAKPALPDALDSAEHLALKIYVLRRIAPGETDEADEFCDEYAVSGPKADLAALLADTGGALRLLAGADGQGGARGCVLLMLPGDMPLRLRTGLSMLLPGIQAEEWRPAGEAEERFLPVSDMESLTKILIESLPQGTEKCREDGEDEKEPGEALAEDDPIDRLDLSIRSYNCLRRAGIHTIGDLRSMDAEDLYRIRNLGRKCAEEIREILAGLPEELLPCPTEQKDPFEELQALIGLEEVKRQIGQITALARMKKDLADSGKNSVPVNLSMAFVGNPGTAKTTVARIAARLLQEVGLLESGLLEVGRADLVARYQGQTAEKVKEVFRRARGKVLFIDEAYSLLEHSRGEYGDEAINTIVQEMENSREDTVVIFAGYPEEMDAFFDRNPGLRSRVPFRIAFPDYSAGELVRIAEQEAEKRGFTLDEGAGERIADLCEAAAGKPDCGNGRFCRNLVEGAVLSYASRVYGDRRPETERDLVLRREDFRVPERRDPAPFSMGFCA